MELKDIDNELFKLTFDKKYTPNQLNFKIKVNKRTIRKFLKALKRVVKTCELIGMNLSIITNELNDTWVLDIKKNKEK